MKPTYESSQQRLGYPPLLVFDTLLNLLPAAGLRIAHVDGGARCVKATQRGGVLFASTEFTFIVQAFREHVTIVRMESAHSSLVGHSFSTGHKLMFSRIVHSLNENLDSQESVKTECATIIAAHHR